MSPLLAFERLLGAKFIWRSTFLLFLRAFLSGWLYLLASLATVSFPNVLLWDLPWSGELLSSGIQWPRSCLRCGGMLKVHDYPKSSYSSMRKIIAVDNLDIVSQLSQFDLEISIERVAGLIPVSLLNPKRKAVPHGFLAESRDIGPGINTSTRTGYIMRGHTLHHFPGRRMDGYPELEPRDIVVIDPEPAVWKEFALDSIDYGTQVVMIRVGAITSGRNHLNAIIRNKSIVGSHPLFLFPGDTSLRDAILALCITAITSVLSAPAENYEVQYIPREISSLIAAAAPSSRSELCAAECSVSAVAIYDSKESSQAEWVAFSIVRPVEEVEPSVEELVRLDILGEEMPF